MLATSPVDLIMLDVSMPGINGWALLENIRQQYPELPVIMVSADASEGLDQGEKENHYQGYFIKPIRLNLLLEHIGQLLNLNWRYEAVEADSADVLQEQTLDGLQLPDPEQLRHLLGLAVIGHRKGLLESLYSLRKTNPASKTFYNELIRLTKDFQFDAIKQLLQVSDNAAQ